MQRMEEVMTQTIDLFGTTIQKTREWVLDLKEQIGLEDEHKALRAMKVVLHALRDRLTVEEAAQVGAQMPVLLRGYYYDGWRPGRKPVKIRHRDEFLAKIQAGLKPDLSLDSEEVTRGVFQVLARHVSRGEVKDIKEILPEEIRELWD